MPDPRNELTAANVRLAGELLMPAFREAVRAEIAPLATRVTELERTNRRALVGWGFLCSLITFIGTTFGGSVVAWAKSRVWIHP